MRFATFALAKIVTSIASYLPFSLGQGTMFDELRQLGLATLINSIAGVALAAAGVIKIASLVTSLLVFGIVFFEWLGLAEIALGFWIIANARSGWATIVTGSVYLVLLLVSLYTYRQDIGCGCTGFLVIPPGTLLVFDATVLCTTLIAMIGCRSRMSVTLRHRPLLLGFSVSFCVLLVLLGGATLGFGSQVGLTSVFAGHTELKATTASDDSFRLVKVIMVNPSSTQLKCVGVGNSCWNQAGFFEPLELGPGDTLALEVLVRTSILKRGTFPLDIVLHDTQEVFREKVHVVPRPKFIFSGFFE